MRFRASALILCLRVLVAGLAAFKLVVTASRLRTCCRRSISSPRAERTFAMLIQGSLQIEAQKMRSFAILRHDSQLRIVLILLHRDQERRGRRTAESRWFSDSILGARHHSYYRSDRREQKPSTHPYSLRRTCGPEELVPSLPQKLPRLARRYYGSTTSLPACCSNENEIDPPQSWRRPLFDCGHRVACERTGNQYISMAASASFSADWRWRRS
jgi:hypothetical protein